MRSSESSVPSVGTPPEKEWPAPATRTPRPRATACATSAEVPGRRCSAGAQDCPRDQLDHMLRGYRRMSWEPELEELRRREALARGMGGPERVARQHASGRLTVRERIERLLDAGSFHETGALAGVGRYEDGELTGFTPANMVVGSGRVDGRRVVV